MAGFGGVEKNPIASMTPDQLTETLEVNRRALVEHRISAVSKKRVGSARDLRRQTARILTRLRSIES